MSGRALAAIPAICPIIFKKSKKRSSVLDLKAIYWTCRLPLEYLKKGDAMTRLCLSRGSLTEVKIK